MIKRITEEGGSGFGFKATGPITTDDVKAIDGGHHPLADHVAVGVVVALPLVDEAAFKTAIGDAQRLVGANGVPRLNDADAVDRPLFLDFDHVGADPDSAESDRRRQPADASSHDQSVSNCGHGSSIANGRDAERGPAAV